MIELLRGTRVLECGSLLCGDTLGGLLGALGADVVKIEAPQRGDYLRDILGQIVPHHSPAHLQFNAHKRSLSIDLTKDAGVEVFWRLLESADVFVDGNLATTCDQLGIGYEAQRARRPSIVYCQYTGLGASGPYAPIPTHGYSMNALAGDLPAEVGEDGLMHQRMPVGILPTKGAEGTNAGAVWAAYAVAAALVRSLRTGEGCYLDVSAADAVVASVALAHSYTLNEHRLSEPATTPLDANGVLTSAKYQLYETKDGKVVIFGCVEPAFWKRFCQAVDREDLLRFDDAARAVDWAQHDVELRRELQRIMHTRTQAEWASLAAENDFSVTPAPRSVHELRADPQMGGRNVFFEGEHPDAGPFTYIGVPVVIPGERFEVRRSAPRQGQHTEELLRELGYDQAGIEELAGAGVV